MSTSLINIAYDIAKKEYQNKDFTFQALWKKVIKFAHLSTDEQNEEVGNFYSDIMQDVRFIYIGNNNWRLKEYVNLGEIDKMQSRMYDFKDVQVLDDSITEQPKSKDDEDYSSKEISEDDLIAPEGFSDEDEDEAYEDMKRNISIDSEEEDEDR